MSPQTDRSVFFGPTTSHSNNPISTTNLQTTEVDNRHFQSARRSHDSPLVQHSPPTSSFPEPPSPRLTAHHPTLAPCYERPSASSAKIPKPPGEVGRPGRGGYNLRKILGWSKQDYDNVKVRSL
ncbi:hypothetical protein C8R41DRAFT_915444 [Lentinula lateritia]|uniref:Uncharacterized protein n=1 Tax=Lentinula lateritia TaxID=40482 RepID=A0ABQ8VS76_9AGAR|nr:hypothetical protein C8R41DRAFT_915444 [Lentinula lateritia]